MGIEDLLAAEGIDICYPAGLPEGVWIENIECLDVNGDKIYSVDFNTNDISIRIQTNCTSLLPSNASREEYIAPIGLFYISKKDDTVKAISIIDNSLYTVSASNNYNIKDILDSIKGNIE